MRGGAVSTVGSTIGSALVFALAVAAVAPDARAQVKASEKASMSQTIDGTVFEMTYSRPSTRGRGELFGGVVHWGERWTPGANVATKLSASEDFHLDGVPIPAGSYSVWMDVLEEGPWQLVLDRDTTLYHTQHPADKDDHILVPFERGHSETSLDALLWYFASIRRDGGELRMQWGHTVASFDVQVEPTTRVTVTPEEAALVTGHWSAHWLRPDGSDGRAWEVDVVHDTETGMLIAEMDGGGDGSDVFFVPMAEGVYGWGWGGDGVLWEVTDLLFEFVSEDGEMPTTFEGRTGEDRLVARGERTDPPSG